MVISQKQKKSFTYSIIILFVLIIFLLGYFYYFIPGNRDTVHRNGFLILRTIASNIENKSSGRLSFYINIYINTKKKDSTILLLKENRIDALVEYVGNNVNEAGIRPAAGTGKITDSISGTISIENERFVFKIREPGTGKGVNFSESASSFLGPILVTQKEELFTTYALGRLNGKASQVIFHDRELVLRSDISLDSLLPNNIQGYMEGIRDISFHDYSQKMFYSPFKLDTTQLVLCGFAGSQQYHATIQKVPLKFVYPLAIVFLLLLVFLPILKFYIMDSNELVNIKDLAWFALSVFIGASVLTLVVIQYLLWQGEEVRVSDNLKNLSVQIEQNFEKELRSAYTQMCILDSLRERDETIKGKSGKGKIDYSETMRNFIRDGNRNPGNYYHFERISWVDSGGQQLIKAEMEGKPVFTNVKERGYFKAFENNMPFLLQDTVLKPFGWEPIYSWTNTDFNICFSKPARDFYITVLATKMQSVVGTILPAGYGFCIIDADGNVMLHSETNRNLRENLFEKAEPARQLIGSVAARQDVHLNDINMYGKWHKMHVHQLQTLPYSLVTFYDKGYIMPVNLRILIFGLMFCFLSALFCTVLWLILSPVQLNRHPFIYCRLDGLTWVTPAEKEARYYFHGFVFLIIYLVFFLCFVRFYNSDFISNFTILSLVLFTPLNVISCLFTIRAAFTLSRDELSAAGEQKLKQKAVMVAIVHVLFSALYYALTTKSQYPINAPFLYFQGLLSLWICFYLLYKPRNNTSPHRALSERDSPGNEKVPEKNSLIKSKWIALRERVQNYLVAYNLMVVFLIICISVLPSGFYTWYAHNQEIIQTLKKQQLHFVEGINKRLGTMRDIAGFDDSQLVPDSYLQNLLEQKGIYTIYNDILKWDTLPANRNKRDAVKDLPSSQSYERFYFNVADNLSNSYYDAQRYPALKDYAEDSSWQWKVKDSLVEFIYNSSLPLRDKALSQMQTLHISSTMPPRFLFLNAGVKGVLLGMFILLLLYGLYKWLWINTQNLFLLKFIQTSRPQEGEKRTGLVAKAYDEGLISYPGEDEDFYFCSDYSPYGINNTEKAYQEREKKVLELARNGKPFYDYIWKECTEKERYLIYNFADSGLINYKNTNEIYGLIAKGILRVHDGKLKLFSPPFRAYVMINSESGEMVELRRKHDQNSTWQALRRPLTLLLLCAASLIFFTQEAMFQKLLALAGGIGSLLSMIPKIYSFNNDKSSGTS